MTLLGLAACATDAAVANDSPPDPGDAAPAAIADEDAAPGPWAYTLAPYLLFPHMDGSATVSGLGTA